MESTISKYALFEYLAGRSNPLERKLMEEWLRNPANHESFYQWLLEWENRSPQFMPDQEQAIKLLLARLDTDVYEEENQDDAVQNETGKGRQLRKFWLIAASIVLLTSCGWWFRESIQYKTYQTAYGKTANVYLEDGTRVSLNSNSLLIVPRFGFEGKVREVFLKGEAEFAVKHTPDHQRFVVKTSDTFQVEVLGTEFSVFSRPRGTKVALKSGSVRIDYSEGSENKEMVMEPGDFASVQHGGAIQLAKKQNIANIAAWKEQRYVFNGTSLREICVMIEENFGEKVTLATPEIADRTITGNFKTKNADDLLKAISEALDLRIRSSGDSTIISTH
jgi:ferric-dicitrate binding protein FerR (iron transport regulator)